MHGHLHDYIDIYCERTAPGFWNEPINAISNGAFILAALWGAYLLWRRRDSDLVLWLLVALAAAIGIGSFLFHTYATVWASYADTTPIWTFVAIYIIVAMLRFFGMKSLRIARVIVIIALVATGFILAMPGGDSDAPPLLNGSLQYAPALAGLIVFSIALARKKHPAAPWIVAAGLTFLASLTFRTMDIAVCGVFPLGTHFLWHSLNGLMIAILLTAMIRHGRPVDD